MTVETVYPIELTGLEMVALQMAVLGTEMETGGLSGPEASALEKLHEALKPYWRLIFRGEEG